jgi:hypothetical protein
VTARFSLKTASQELEAWGEEWRSLRKEWEVLRDKTTRHLGTLDQLIRQAGWRKPSSTRRAQQEVGEILRLMEGELLWSRMLRVLDGVKRASDLEEAVPEDVLKACRTLRTFYAEELDQAQQADDLSSGLERAQSQEAPRLRAGLQRLSRLETLLSELISFRGY